MDLQESEDDGFAKKLHANMNDLVSSFWNKIMRDCGLETWTIGDGSHSEPPSSLDKLLRTPLDLEKETDLDKDSDVPEEELSPPTLAPPIPASLDSAELHSIDSFSNEQFDAIFTLAPAGSQDETATQQQQEEEAGTPSGSPPCTPIASKISDENVVTIDDSDSNGSVSHDDSEKHEMEDGAKTSPGSAETSAPDAETSAPLPSSGSKRGREDEAVGQENAKVPRMMVSSFSGSGYPLVRMNLIGME